MRHQCTYDEYGLCFECDKAMPKTNTERSQALRKKRRALGITQLQLWLTPKEKEAVKAYLAKLRKAK